MRVAPVNPPVPFNGYKKGVPVQTIWSNRELTAPQEVSACQSLGVGWAYNYLPAWDTSCPAVQFTPMIFQPSFLTAPNLAAAEAYNTRILAYNEPYNPPPQANTTPAAAASDWPTFLATARPLGCPSTTIGQTWLATFEGLLGAPEWDVTMIHFYSGNFTQPDVVQASLEGLINTLFTTYGKRCIISEFGLINFVSSDPATWLYPTVVQAQAQLNLSGPKLNANDLVLGWTPYPLTINAAARIVNPNAANGTLCNLDASLTALGTTYQQIVNYP
jgi:hypothetical protein